MEPIFLTGEALQGVGPHLETFAELPQKVKLGRKRPKALPACLKLEPYINQNVELPPSINRRDKAAQSTARMYLNDEYGDCVIAGKGHWLGVVSSNDSDSPGIVMCTDQEILSQYHSICGPGDNGCNITDVLDVMRSAGFIASGQRHKIDGYVSVDWTNQQVVKAALVLFGGLVLGINLPKAWTSNAVWDVTNTQIVGGHDVTAIDYDDSGVYISSWGRIYRITWPAFQSRQWIEECYALLGPDWYGNDQVNSTTGLATAVLRDDLAKIANGVIPDIGPPTPPTPPAPPTPPIPQTFSINVPQQPVKILGASIGYVPAYTIQGTLNRRGAMAVTIPPFVLLLLRLACRSGIVLPAPYNLVVSALCALLPQQGEESNQTLTLPPWLMPILLGLCGEVQYLPEPYRSIAAVVCSLIPKLEEHQPCAGCR